MKLRKITFGLLLTCAATATSCFGGNADVTFWSPFGSKYSEKLEAIVQDMGDELGFKISHKSISGYPNILKDMSAANSSGTYPDIAVGYPDHFVTYQSVEMLRPLTSYFSEAELSDYVDSYMPENYLYDDYGVKTLYGIPFNKSTELLGYNGVFIDYCVQLYGEGMRTLPKTWDEWADVTPGSKVSKYLQTFNELIASQTQWYATQATDGSCTDFSTSQGPGQVKVFDYKDIDAKECALFTYDSPDNAFITLVRQWGGRYTELPESERTKFGLLRKGHVLFSNSEYWDETLSMLKFFNRMNKNGIFSLPEVLGKAYSSSSFEKGKVMFMICSSGGLGYNTGSWQNRFRLAPVPYKEANKKYVISQGANLCLTDASNDPTNAVKVMKGLTTGKFQTRWTRETGYFPASKSSEQSEEYRRFLHPEQFGEAIDYSDHDAVAYREGAIVNTDTYSKESEGWIRFVDDAFVGSSDIREAVKNALPYVLKSVPEADLDNDEKYAIQMKEVLKALNNHNNVVVERHPDLQ